MPTTTSIQRSFRLGYATDLLGTNVVNRAGENLGSLEDFKIDTTTGRILYGIMEAGGFLGVGARHYAIPWALFRQDEGDNTLFVDLPKERFDTAPAYNDDADSNKMDIVYAYHGVSPLSNVT